MWNAIRYHSHRLAAATREREREKRKKIFLSSHKINLISVAMLFFTEAILLFILSLAILFSLLALFSCASLATDRANGKFSVLRWCYDLCTIAKCMNNSIVVTIIHYSFFFSISLSLCIENLRKVEEDTEKKFFQIFMVYLSKNVGTELEKWNSHQLPKSRIKTKWREWEKNAWTYFGGCLEYTIVEHINKMEMKNWRSSTKKGHTTHPKWNRTLDENEEEKTIHTQNVIISYKLNFWFFGLRLYVPFRSIFAVIVCALVQFSFSMPVFSGCMVVFA